MDLFTFLFNAIFIVVKGRTHTEIKAVEAAEALKEASSIVIVPGSV